MDDLNENTTGQTTQKSINASADGGDTTGKRPTINEKLMKAESIKQGMENGEVEEHNETIAKSVGNAVSDGQKPPENVQENFHGEIDNFPNGSSNGQGASMEEENIQVQKAWKFVEKEHSYAFGYTESGDEEEDIEEAIDPIVKGIEVKNLVNGSSNYQRVTATAETGIIEDDWDSVAMEHSYGEKINDEKRSGQTPQKQTVSKSLGESVSDSQEPMKKIQKTTNGTKEKDRDGSLSTDSSITNQSSNDKECTKQEVSNALGEAVFNSQEPVGKTHKNTNGPEESLIETASACEKDKNESLSTDSTVPDRSSNDKHIAMEAKKSPSSMDKHQMEEMDAIIAASMSILDDVSDMEAELADLEVYQITSRPLEPAKKISDSDWKKEQEIATKIFEKEWLKAENKVRAEKNLLTDPRKRKTDRELIMEAKKAATAQFVAQQAVGGAFVPPHRRNHPMAIMRARSGAVSPKPMPDVPMNNQSTRISNQPRFPVMPRNATNPELKMSLDLISKIHNSNRPVVVKPTIDHIRHWVDGNKIHCKPCRNTFIDFFFYLLHMKNHHQRAYDIFRVELINDYKKHSARGHKETELISVPADHPWSISLKLNICPLCITIFRNEFLLSNHVWNHDILEQPPVVIPKKQYICLHCSPAVDLGAMKLLRKHRETVHGIKSIVYNCEMCPRKLYSRNAAEKHEKLCKERRPWKCDHCRRRFPTYKLVAKHETEKHTKIAIYHCNECKFRCERGNELKKHKMNKHKEP